MKTTILIVEDEQSLAKTMEFALADAGYVVVSAVDGEEGIEKAESAAPDLILLDILLPKKSGLEVLQEIKKNPRLQSIPVFMLTNLSDEHSISEAIAGGARGYFVKSDMTLEDLVAKVKEIVPPGGGKEEEGQEA